MVTLETLAYQDYQEWKVSQKSEFRVKGSIRKEVSIGMNLLFYSFTLWTFQNRPQVNQDHFMDNLALLDQKGFQERMDQMVS